jgi:hypothetical protein
MADNWERLAEHCAGLDQYRRKEAPRRSSESTEASLGNPKSE